jgi:hypothetical protein
MRNASRHRRMTTALLGLVLVLPATVGPSAAGLRDEARHNGAGSSTVGAHVGLFGRFTRFDDDLGDSHGLGGGLRLGVTLTRQLALEADASVNDMIRGGDLTFTPIHVRLVGSVPMGERSAWTIGAGGAMAQFEGSAFEGLGLSFISGIQNRAGRSTVLRLDVVADYIMDPDGPIVFVRPNSHQLGTNDGDWHVGLEFGLQHGGRLGSGDD